MECRSAAVLDRELSVRPAALVIAPVVAPSSVRVLPLSKLATVAHHHGGEHRICQCEYIVMTYEAVGASRSRPELVVAIGGDDNHTARVVFVSFRRVPSG